MTTAVRADARKRREPPTLPPELLWWPDERPDAETSAIGRLWIERIDHEER